MDAKVEELDEANRIDAEGSDEELYRQIHPNFIVNGRITSQAFNPTPEHNLQLSVSRGSLTSPTESWRAHTEQKGRKSCGVGTIKVSHCRARSLPVYADPVTAPPQDADPAHALVDFRPIDDKKTRKAHASALSELATFTPMLAAVQPDVEEP